MNAAVIVGTRPFAQLGRNRKLELRRTAGRLTGNLVRVASVAFAFGMALTAVGLAAVACGDLARKKPLGIDFSLSRAALFMARFCSRLMT